MQVLYFCLLYVLPLEIQLSRVVVWIPLTRVILPHFCDLLCLDFQRHMSFVCLFVVVFCVCWCFLL